MSVLDDARRLADRLDRGGDGPWVPENPHVMRCLGCNVDLVEASHAPDCPWLSMPKIVAVVEAAQRLAETSKRHGQSGFCWGCGRLRSRALVDGLSEHKADCPWAALVAALEG